MTKTGHFLRVAIYMTCLFAGPMSGISAQTLPQSIDINAVSLRSLQVQESTDPVVIEMFKDVDRYRTFNFNNQLANLRTENVGDTLLLNFFDDKQYKSVIQRVVENSSGRTSITSKILESEFAYCYMVVSETTITISAELPLKDEYFFASVKNGQAYVGQMTMTELKRNMPKGGEPLMPGVPDNNNEDPRPVSTALRASNDHVTIDVLVVYTQAAEEWAATSAGVTDIHDAITQAINRSNMVTENSNTGVTFNVVYEYKTDYEEAFPEDANVDLRRITNPSDGYMDEIHDLKNVFYADQIVLLEILNTVGGLGWLLQNENGNANYSVALCGVQYSHNSFNVIHEIGHNMGCSHHYDQLPHPTNPGVYPYSYGWRGTSSSFFGNKKYVL